MGASKQLEVDLLEEGLKNARHERVAGGTWPYLPLQALLTFAIVFVSLRLWRVDLEVPFNYWGDTVFELALVKSIAEGGWIWHIAQLGAPFDLGIVAFPQNLTTSSLLMKAIAAANDSPGFVLNVFWIVSIVLTSLFCHASLRALGVSAGVALVASSLYAAMPYAFFRNTAHISLTYMFVPVVAAFAVELLSRTARQHARRVPRALLVACCIAIGFDYIYNAFFSCFFLALAGIAAGARARQVRPLFQATKYIAIIVACAGINLAPSLLHWQTNGPPPNLGYKTPVDSEVYGLKIRHLLTPANEKLASAMRLKPGVAFPIENENQWASLGAVGAIGFLLSLYWGLLGNRTGRSGLRWSAGVLTIGGVLLATVGGLGAIFNTVVTPDIRAYNRIVVFIAFFAFLLLSWHLDDLLHALRSRLGNHDWAMKLAPAACLAAVLVLGWGDSEGAAKPLRARYPADVDQVAEERQVVRQIEALPGVHAIYQLPETPFPLDGGRERMLTYDHGRPWLWSRELSWSWPSFSRKRQAWQEAVGGPADPGFIRKLAASGFDGIWLDRHGYSPADAARVESVLAASLGAAVVISQSGRYQFFSLEREHARRDSQLSDRQKLLERETLLHPIVPSFESGFHLEESSQDGRHRHRWSNKDSVMSLVNGSSIARTIRFRAQLRANPNSELRIADQESITNIPLADGTGTLDLVLTIAPHARREVRFSFEGPRIHAPDDPRSMYFALHDSVIQEISN